MAKHYDVEFTVRGITCRTTCAVITGYSTEADIPKMIEIKYGPGTEINKIESVETEAKAMDYLQFVEKFTIAAREHESNVFLLFRWDYATNGAFVLTHAYNVWSTNYDKWDNAVAFAINYISVIEGNETGTRDKIRKWNEHGRMIRSIYIGA